MGPMRGAHVAPRKTVACRKPSGVSAKCASGRVKTEASQEPTGTGIHGTAMNSHTAPRTSRKASNDEPAQVIPPDCCTHCLTRGGKAAYQCVKADGEIRCTRCISDKRSKCRLPTPEEAEKIAARCPRCTVRGFKACNGGNPCDTCIRNKTSENCQTIGHNKGQTGPNLSEASLLVNDSAIGTDSSDVLRSARRKSDQKGRNKSETANAEKLRKTKYRERMKRESSTEESEANCEIPKSSARGDTLLESDLQDLIRFEEFADHSSLDSSPPPTSNATVRPLQQASSYGQSRKRKAAQSDLVRHSDKRFIRGVLIGAESHANSPSLGIPVQVPIRESNVTADHAPSNDDIEMTEDKENYDLNTFKSARPRRRHGRVSYVEIPEDADSDYKILTANDSDTDAYTASTTEDELEEDEVEEDDASFPEDIEHRLNFDDIETPGEIFSEGCDNSDEDEVMAGLTDCFRKTKTKSASKPKAGKGIDFSLPPLNNVKDCFSDLATKGLQCGLLEALKGLGSTSIKVATMCSGTESPLLALNEISRGLQEADQPAIQFQHVFSAEIEPFKQAYIERNFQPKILFRDVRDFIRAGARTATTAYGAKVDIPSDIDILVAGFVCKDLSRLNNSGKTLEDGGESGDTWLAIYTYAKRFRPRVVLLENVKATKQTWEDLVLRWDKIDYEAVWIYRDTKTYYLPQTRERMYMCAIERSQFGPKVSKAARGWYDTMEKLQRQCSSPYEAFIAGSLQDPSNYTTPLSEPDWPLCKLRYDHIRSKEKLGNLSPVTLSNGSGAVRPPDFASRQYYESQSSRVWDAIDIAHLQGARAGYDSLYKMAVWDVSQNVDRFRAELGILPCITPGGSDFASNRQQALSGNQLLLLQGMPLDRLLFANETQRDRQDLAGNAMSTTVIGASLIAAIIWSWRSFASSNQRNLQPSISSAPISTTPDVSAKWLEFPHTLQKSSLKTKVYLLLNLAALKIDATRSARLCHCEGTKLTSRSPMQECLQCGHTACSACAGNPKHEYHGLETAPNHRLAPNVFIQTWRPRLPPRIIFRKFADLDKIFSGQQDTCITEYLRVVQEAHLNSQYFCIGDFSRRAHSWTITYSSPKATLQLEAGRSVQWLLFIKCPPGLPGNSSIREFLRMPIARADVNESLLDPRWEVYLPSGSTHQLHMRGSSERNRSWRARLGLVDHQEETVPSELTIKCNSRDLENLDGKYQYLPDCGTASNCLYKRSSQPPLYMFLDPNPIGSSDADGIVFSHDRSRKHYGESRIILASMESSWRPWTMAEDLTSTVTAKQSGTWHSASMPLSPACGTVHVSHLVKSNLDSVVVQDCSRVLMCLDVHVRERLSSHAFHAYSWALEQPKTLPAFPVWQHIKATFNQECSCTPPYPELLWNVNEKGVAVAQEDSKSAAIFEHAVKSQPSAIQIKVKSESDSTRIQVGLNISSLLHRVRASLGRAESVTAAWRLLTDHADLPAQPFAEFYLKSNTKDAAPVASTLPSYLGDAQAKSLAWMIEQEHGRQIIITEVEEEIHAGLGWRLEVRAQTTRYARGGVLADLPSFGKTVTTIALIQNEFNLHSPGSIIRQNQSLVTEQSPALINTAATLIVCPPHIAPQWRTEFGAFLDTEGFTLDNVLLIEDYADLRELDMERLQNSRAIIVSWTVFADDEYISQVAQFTAMPEPALTGRRAFDTWFSRANGDIPSRLAVLRNNTYQDFQDSTVELLQERLQQPQFRATLPLQVRHGSAYKSFSAIHPSGTHRNSTAKGKASFGVKCARRKAKGIVPLLHLYQFNRIVIDEYHYLNDEKNFKNSLAAISVKKIAAHKRWVLSGTPAMTNFTDIDQIASFLGIRLGRTHFGDGATTTQTEKMVKAEETRVEDFLSRTELKSRQWHEARHGQAQGFLDLFVRQNEAELQHISCLEKLQPIQLDAAHCAVYLELSQHLIAQKMQLKKLSKKISSDKTERLNESLNNSGSAEIALIKSALTFRTDHGQSGLEGLKRRRSDQLRDTKVELASILCGLEGLMPAEHRKLQKISSLNPKAYKQKLDESIVTLYARFKADVKRSNWLGDSAASRSIGGLLVQAKDSPNSRGVPELEGLSGEKRQRGMKQQLSRVRELSRELALRTRSQRFIYSVEEASKQLTSGQVQAYKCSAPDCTGASSSQDMRIITHCGHTACKRCLDKRIDDEICIDPGCNARIHEANLVRMSDLGSIEAKRNDRGFGQKMEAIAELILGLPDDDQGLVFVPNADIVPDIEEVFDHFGITYCSPILRTASKSAHIIEGFKNNTRPGECKKILILNLGSESAAGVNLTNANHIIFVSPLAAKTQYEYESAMVQAIARSRRYGQLKKVHIYHVIAERTIDVDIMERRHKRNDGITTAESSMKLPAAVGAVKEKTKLIQNKKGQMALVPRSWLEDEAKRKLLNVDKPVKPFTSLINFGVTYEHDDE